jgi:hypothetical protein
MDNGIFSKVKSWIVNQAWLAIVVTFFTIVLGILLNEIQPKLGWSILVISLITIIAIFSIVVWLVVRFVFSVTFDFAQGIQDTLDRYIASEKIGWMLTTPKLCKFEKQSKAPEIWLISSDLSEDCIGGPFQRVVAANLKRGIRYRYFVPDKPEIRSRVKQLVEYNKNPQNLEFTYLSDDFFFLVPKFDFAIYNPLKEKGTERVAYMGIPVSGDPGRYHANIGDELIDVLVGKLLSLISENK